MTIQRAQMRDLWWIQLGWCALWGAGELALLIGGKLSLGSQIIAAAAAAISFFLAGIVAAQRAARRPKQDAQRTLNARRT